jgi:hypothetical protein
MAANKTELLHECMERFGKKISRGWVDSSIKCHNEQLLETKSIPQDNPRLQVLETLPEAAIEGS